MTLVLLAVILVVLFVVLLFQFSGATKMNTRLDEFSRNLNAQTEQEAQRIQHLEETFRGLEKDLRTDVDSVRVKVDESLEKNTRQLGERVKELIDLNKRQLAEISVKVEERLEKGFEKTTSVFADVLKRLALIDKAQEKIAELSGNVVSLQEVLSDKRSRGAIDSKFPLENYQRMTDLTLGDADRKSAEQQFRQDIKKHIKDISSKYIISGKTSDGAVMFIPAEAVFAEIHGHYPELVEEAQRARVWLASPTTMMAVLTTARAVLKDSATRKQVHIIQDHLGALSQDFSRFQQRMDKLATHIDQANRDVLDVNKSARKITNRFTKIEKVELEGDESALLDDSE